MKKIANSLLFILITLFAYSQQSVPNTTTFSLQNVYDVVKGHAPATSGNLQSCFNNSVDSYFDASYKGSKDRLSNFRNYTRALQAGDPYQGGVIAYVYQSGDDCWVSGEFHGIIAATTDVGTVWPFTTNNNTLPNGSSYYLCDGLSNTESIVSTLGFDFYAAAVCYELERDGYSDWVLPSLEELQKVYATRSAIGNFTGARYWSSSTYNVTFPNVNNAHTIDFSNGAISNESFNWDLRVRPVRYF